LWKKFLGAVLPPRYHQAMTSSPTPQAELAAQLDGILAGLLLVVVAVSRALGGFILPVWARISRARQRLARLFADLARGRLPRPRLPAPGRKGGQPAPYIPRRAGWLVHVAGYQAAGHASQLHHLLHLPEVQATLAAAPPAAVAALSRRLRPLCRLLGVELPPLLAPPPKPPRPRPARPPRPQPPELPKLLPLYPQSRPRDMPFLRAGRKIEPA